MVTSRELIRLVDSPTSGGVAKKTLAPDSGVSRRRFVDACSVADEVVAKSRDTARCAGHDQQLGSESLLLNLMEVKG